MHILLFIHITQNSQSALFHDAKIPNLALFRESKIPNMRGTGPIPNEAKKIADMCASCDCVSVVQYCICVPAVTVCQLCSSAYVCQL